VYEAGHDGKYGSYRKDIVEVGNYIVGVVKYNVY